METGRPLPGLRSIAGDIGEVNASAGDIVLRSRQMKSGTDRLSDLAAGLENMVGKFRI